VDPEKCTEVPANLVDELMNVLIPIEVILQNPEKSALLTKIERPSRAGFYRYQRWFIANPEQGSKLMIARYGQEYYEKYLMCFDTYVHLASLPLQYVFADHCLIDIFIVDDETRTTVFRVWVTLLIDCYSRSILGMAILNESPCIESIQSALANAIWDKTKFLRELGLEYPEGNGWEIFGIPVSLSLDNAWAHLSLSLENLCRNISCHGRFTGIELNFRPPYKGRYGAVIERYFGNLQAKIKEANLAGAIRNKSASGVRNSAKEAKLLLYDIKRAVAQLIVIYQNTPHSELDGMTPNEKWREGMASGWPQVPERNPANERLFWRGDPNTHRITRHAIHAFGLSFSSNELETCERIGTDGTVVEYSITYQPIDISRIALFRDGTYLFDLYAQRLRLPDNTYLQVSIADRQLALKIARSRDQANTDWVAYVQEAQELNKKRGAEQKAAKRDQARAARKAAESPAANLTYQESGSQLDRLRSFQTTQ
jgi:transposase InsO family protein